MTANKEWPCEHIHKQKNGPWLYNSTSQVLHSWIHCPDCEARRPEEPQALYELLHEIHDASYGTQALEIIKWFEDNLPNYIQENNAYAYRGRILDWLYKEKEKCK